MLKISEQEGGEMRRNSIVWLIFVIIGSYAAATAAPPETLNLRGFFLGMGKADVDKVYQECKSNAVAKYISIEKAEFRDLIQVDNEFGSMGNKIELNYDEK
jgi:hypothetical protein